MSMINVELAGLFMLQQVNIKCDAHGFCEHNGCFADCMQTYVMEGSLLQA
jgi:hypothetical protein